MLGVFRKKTDVDMNEIPWRKRFGTKRKATEIEKKTKVLKKYYYYYYYNDAKRKIEYEKFWPPETEDD